METLQEFVRFTKGWEYLIAIGFIALWMVFWALLRPGGTSEVRNPASKQAEAAPASVKKEPELVGSGRSFSKH